MLLVFSSKDSFEFDFEMGFCSCYYALWGYCYLTRLKALAGICGDGYYYYVDFIYLINQVQQKYIFNQSVVHVAALILISLSFIK